MTVALEKRTDYWERLGKVAEELGMDPPLILMAMRLKRRLRMSEDRKAELGARFAKAFLPFLERWICNRPARDPRAQNKGEA